MNLISFWNAPLRTAMVGFLMITCLQTVKSQAFSWLYSPPSNETGIIEDIVSDEAGNSYILGHFDKTFTLDTLKMVGTGQRHSFLARLNTLGKLDWVYPLFDVNILHDIRARKLALGPGGRLYVCGDVHRIGIIGGNQIITGQSGDGWIARFDTSGSLIWIDAIETFYAQTGHAWRYPRICITSTGNAVMSGAYVGDLEFKNSFQIQALDPNWLSNNIIVSYKPDGGINWTVNCGSRLASKGTGSWGPSDIGFWINDLAADGYGNVYIAGVAGDSARIGDSLHVNGGLVTARINQDGSVAWFKTWPTKTSITEQHIVSDVFGNLYFLGTFNDSLSFEGNVLRSDGDTDVLLAQLDKDGNLKWHKQLPGNAREYAQALDMTEEHKLGAIIHHHDSLRIDQFQFAATDSTDSTSWETTDLAFVQWDSLGKAEWAISAFNGRGRVAETNDLSHDGKGNFYFSGNFKQNEIRFGSLELPNRTTTGIYAGKILRKVNFIDARAFRDWNQNGIQDSSEEGISNLLISVEPIQAGYFTSRTGKITAAVDSGNYTITLPYLPPYHDLTVATHTANFPGFYARDTNNLFALKPIPNINDLGIMLVPRTPFRPGRKAIIYAHYANLGTTVADGYVMVVHDTTLMLKTAIPTPDVIKGDTLLWNFNQLQIGDTGIIKMYYDVDITARMGQALKVEAFIEAAVEDSTPVNNHARTYPVIVTSYDPNDKTVYPEMANPGRVANGSQWLTYRIRFQNTGNDTAFVVRVRDTLSNQLDWSTFQMETTSHPYELSIRGGNRLEWVFHNILLPDSTTNEPESHGFIRFRIKPKRTLVLGDAIPNRVSIYFDYNAPVETNTAITTVDTVVAISPRHPDEELRFLVYPNPASDILNISGELNSNAPLRCELLDLQGRTVAHWDWEVTPGQLNEHMDIGQLDAGVYLLKIRQGSFQGMRKILIR